MRRFSPEFIEQVRLASSIVDIIGEDTFLKPSAGADRYMGLCPFPSHNEKTPSFSVSADKQLYHCFGCGLSGNVFTYLSEKRGLSFGTALRELARRAGLALPVMEDGGSEDEKAYLERQKCLDTNELACRFYEKNLIKTPAVKKYLKDRGFSEETVKEFRLGYAPPSWTELLNFLKDQNLSYAKKLGLIREKQGRMYDLFRGRIMFPIFSKTGREVTGFGGRILKDSKSAKYINSVDSLVFHKGKTFYGWSKALPFIRQAGFVLVVEGYTDYLSLYQNGVKNVAATLGTALTDYHARDISRVCDQAVLFFDGDLAGKTAALRSLSILLSFGVTAKLLELEEDLDPDSYISRLGVDSLKKKLKKAPDLFMHFFSSELKKQPLDFAGKCSLLKKMAVIVASMKNENLKKYYSQRILDSFGMEENIAQSALKKAVAEVQKHRNKPLDLESAVLIKEESPAKISLKNCFKPELYLLVLALQNVKFYRQIEESGVLKNINHLGILSLFDKIKKHLKTELANFSSLPGLLSVYLLEPGLLQKENYSLLCRLPQADTSRFIKDCIDKIEKEKKTMEINKITADMRLYPSDSSKYLTKLARLTKKTMEKEA